MTTRCKHPQVRIVSRTEDGEFVECQNCREVFDSAEFDDMVIEEKSLASPNEGLADDPLEDAPKA